MKAISKALELELHFAIKGKSEIALSKLHSTFGLDIVRILKSKYQSAARRDEALIFEAVNDALLGYFLNPDTFNPDKYKLSTFLLVAADRDLQNILNRKINRQTGRKDLPEDVELEEKFWNSIIKAEGSADDTIQIDETMKAIQNLLESVFQNELDVTLAWMILGNERETEAYIELLEIESLTTSEQQNEVNKIKDRIKKVFTRHDLFNKIKGLLR